MYMTLEEVLRKLGELIERKELRGGLLVTEATVVHENDLEMTEQFAPGTVVLECADSVNQNVYQVWVNPDRVSERLN